MMAVTPRTETVPSPLPVILGFLMLGPRHPYELDRLFTAEMGGVWRVGRSHLYAHLKRLAADGLAQERTETRGPRPARTVYAVTPEGRAAFRSWMREPVRHVRHIRLELLARLYFHRKLGLKGLGQLMGRQHELLAGRAESLSASIPETADPYWRLVLEFRLAEVAAIDDWLERCRELDT
jgi:DNA-binding PadR family transcriptional regulator